MAQGWKLDCEKAWNLATNLTKYLQKQVGIMIDGDQYEWPKDYYQVDYCYKLSMFPLFY